MPGTEGDMPIGPEQEIQFRRLENKFTFLKELEWLHHEEIGRSLFLIYPKTDKKPEREELAGCFLPLRKDNTKHLLILRNGDSFFLEPLLDRRSNADNTETIETYQDSFAPNDETFRFHSPKLTGDENKDLSRIVGWIRYDTKIYRVNRNNRHGELLNAVYLKALQLAKEDKQEREGSRDNSIVIFHKIMERVFGQDGFPSDVDPDDPPPATGLPPAA